MLSRTRTYNHRKSLTTPGLIGTWCALACLACLLQGCIYDHFPEDDVQGKGYVTMLFSTLGSETRTRTAGEVVDGGIQDVLTENTTVNEAQIHSALVALFAPAGADNEKTLEHLFWFADDSAPLAQLLKGYNGGNAIDLSAYANDQESVMGFVSLSSDKALATASTKALWPGWYHTIVYGNFLSPQLCMNLFGLTQVKALMDLTQDQVAAKGITLQQFKQAFATYATGPLSEPPATGVPTDVYIKEQGSYDNTSWDNLLGGYADNLYTEAEAEAESSFDPVTAKPYYHQSFFEDANLAIHGGNTETAPQQFTVDMNRALSKVRVNITNIDESGNIYEGTDDYWLSVSDGIKLKNWIPFAPTMQWADYDITPGTPTTYTVHDKNGTRVVTGIEDLNVSWMQLDYTEFEEENNEYDILGNSEMADYRPYTYSKVFKQPLQYFLSRQNASYMTMDETDPMNPVPTVRQLPLLTGAVDGLTSTDPAAYNAQLFNCYIAPWSPLFPKQTASNATTIQITLERRQTDGKPVAGSQRVYEIPLFNPETDPNVQTPNLIDTHTYLRDGDYSKYTILRNYLYDIDIVFRGPNYGLKVTVSINPWNAVGKDEWILYDLEANRRSETFEVQAQSAAWTDESEAPLEFN